MKSVGEAMGIGRTFTEAFLKAFGSRELDPGSPTPWATIDDLPEGLHPWFVEQLEAAKRELRTGDIRRAKRAGWGDDSIGAAWGTSGDDVRRARYARGIKPSYRRVDSCGGEVEAGSNYLYSTWGEQDEGPPPGDRQRVVILGSGPNRIGQGIEFDYCCVHAVQTFRELGYEAVMVNCNPETVSTDYDTSDRLYFEPLSPEEVLAVLDREQPLGVVTQFGGQTPLRLARHIEARGLPDPRARRTPRSTSPRTASSSAPWRATSASAARPGARSRASTRRSRPRARSATRCSCGRPTSSAAARCGSATTRTTSAPRWAPSAAPC